ncbi:glycosyltransferase family 2 protein [Sphingomonas sp.]|uniref:glycosyltransferase family 2 protein n=1 Tax=Sphingomonas sp. TaxID=28214 RepID=UPI00286E2A6C|nr:glycosyltransferase family 2 protein [Sphingomonas sp.]
MLLSICIPTFNRCALVVALVGGLLEQRGDFEVCVHVDGATDGTAEELVAIADPRLRVTTAPNRGRAASLHHAVARARGEFTMLFDDDDVLRAAGLERVLADCAQPLPVGVIGFIYQLAGADGRQLGSDFPAERSNFLALRNDAGVAGDKKEVVRTDLLWRAMGKAPSGTRRVPTSLYWSLLALDGDILCRNAIIGEKQYLAGGMSHGIAALKAGNSRPMAALYKTQLKGFAARRFRSPRAAARALAGLVWYGSAAALRGR